MARDIFPNIFLLWTVFLQEVTSLKIPTTCSSKFVFRTFQENTNICWLFKVIRPRNSECVLWTEVWWTHAFAPRI